ncbi:MAG: hypothetical protein KME27_30340 [Lyngbya sp. HA4199-MV5]|jgi:integrase|nr:hypothetical protein [Lyngbya sp. HA4199-MV5]
MLDAVERRLSECPPQLQLLNCSDELLMQDREQMKPNFWTTEQMDRLLEEGCLTNRDRAFFGILRYLGAHPYSVYQLTVHDVDLIGRLIIFNQSNSKTGRTHYVAIPEPLYQILLCYHPSSETLFPDWYGGCKRASLQATMILQKACLRVGLPRITLHYFRAWLWQELSNYQF